MRDIFIPEELKEAFLTYKESVPVVANGKLVGRAEVKREGVKLKAEVTFYAEWIGSKKTETLKESGFQLVPEGLGTASEKGFRDFTITKLRVNP